MARGLKNTFSFFPRWFSRTFWALGSGGGGGWGSISPYFNSTNKRCPTKRQVYIGISLLVNPDDGSVFSLCLQK